MCEICGRTYGHDPRCPYYSPLKARIYCQICGDGIVAEDEYVNNPDGETVHFDCIPGVRWLLEWMGTDIEVMDEG